VFCVLIAATTVTKTGAKERIASFQNRENALLSVKLQFLMCLSWADF